ncbi:hypothetical protein [Trinickia dinghuensis]|uniref:Uncharacterized protein n=1 Tax=Trinickia dinghuensis TaxID=2291023 RepID=A0A3D8JSH5_9BURK|nr:hypothetical protein [Trinickia dinghuensis]RDU96079.1 hypothetical protein DWV00_25910 [Trinickia dinghuensis]
MKRTAFLFLYLLIGLAAGRAFAAKPLFDNETEDPTNGWSHVTPAFAKVLMKHEAQLQDLSGFAEAGEIPKDASTRLVQKAVPIGLHGQKVLYVRPTLEPYFTPFYGAHIFQHWLVLNGHIFYEDSSDGFRVLSSAHDGMRDIEETQCTAVDCNSMRLKFDRKSRSYKAASCREAPALDKNKTKPCGLGQ